MVKKLITGAFLMLFSITVLAQFPAKYGYTTWFNSLERSYPDRPVLFGPDSVIQSVTIQDFIDRTGLDSLISAGSGIYGGSGTVGDGTTALTNAAPKGLIFNYTQSNYQQFEGAGAFETGLYYDLTNGTGPNYESFIGVEGENTPPVMHFRYYNHGFGATEDYFGLRFTNSNAYFDDTRATQTGIRYNFANFGDLQSNSLIPKQLLDEGLAGKADTSTVNDLQSKGIYKNDTEAGAAGVQIGEYYELSETNTLGGSPGDIRRRRF